MANNTALALLREKMQQNQLDYYLVGSSDPHNDEYVPDTGDISFMFQDLVAALAIC